MTFVFLGVGNIVSSASTADSLREIGGWVGIVDALVGFYLAFALMMNAMLERPVVPIGLYRPRE
ncbi:MAG: hypothetical protein JWQ20_2399 [Conexibacter sp.]|nr:hypothetical protein [Conexibacter sp.]